MPMIAGIQVAALTEKESGFPRLGE